MYNWNEIFKKGAKYRPLNTIFLAKVLDEIKKISPDNQQKTMIDIGCGTGGSLLDFSQKGFNITGIDISDVAIQEAEELLKKEGVEDFNLSIMNASEISSIKEKFDIIFSKSVYAFIENKEKFIDDVKKLMDENSVFILITPVLYKDIKYTLEDKPKIAVDFEETKTFLENNFGSAEVFHHDYFAKNGDSVTFLIKK